MTRTGTDYLSVGIEGTAESEEQRQDQIDDAPIRIGREADRICGMVDSLVHSILDGAEGELAEQIERSASLRRQFKEIVRAWQDLVKRRPDTIDELLSTIICTENFLSVHLADDPDIKRSLVDLLKYIRETLIALDG
jgi:hypothetical protein